MLHTIIVSQVDHIAPGLSLSRVQEPKFHFLEINTANLSGLGPHISVDNRIQLVKV